MTTPTTPHDPEHALEAAITRVLEQQPKPAIPADFAVRLLTTLPPLHAARRPLHAGRTLAIIGAFLLAIALFVLASLATPSFASVAFDIELLLLAQMALIAWLLILSHNL